MTLPTGKGELIKTSAEFYEEYDKFMLENDCSYDFSIEEMIHNCKNYKNKTLIENKNHVITDYKQCNLFVTGIGSKITSNDNTRERIISECNNLILVSNTPEAAIISSGNDATIISLCDDAQIISTGNNANIQLYDSGYTFVVSNGNNATITAKSANPHIVVNGKNTKVIIKKTFFWADPCIKAIQGTEITFYDKTIIIDNDTYKENVFYHIKDDKIIEATEEELIDKDYLESDE